MDDNTELYIKLLEVTEVYMSQSKIQERFTELNPSMDESNQESLDRWLHSISVQTTDLLMAWYIMGDNPTLEQTVDKFKELYDERTFTPYEEEPSSFFPMSNIGTIYGDENKSALELAITIRTEMMETLVPELYEKLQQVKNELHKKPKYFDKLLTFLQTKTPLVRYFNSAKTAVRNIYRS